METVKREPPAPFAENGEGGSKDPRYTVSNWAGFKVLNCTACAFDTMYEEVFDAHWADRHDNPQPVRQPLTATLFDPAGKLITER